MVGYLLFLEQSTLYRQSALYHTNKKRNKINELYFLVKIYNLKFKILDLCDIKSAQKVFIINTAHISVHKFWVLGN